jgi:hypothetical protein
VGDWDGASDASVVGFISQRWAILFAHAFIGEERAGDIIKSTLEDGVSSKEAFTLGVMVIGVVSHALSQSGEDGLGSGIKIG